MGGKSTTTPLIRCVMVVKRYILSLRLSYLSKRNVIKTITNKNLCCVYEHSGRGTVAWVRDQPSEQVKMLAVWHEMKIKES
jgi:hypothetical protein